MTPALWRAPGADQPLDATLALPGSKSLTNRALILAAISDGPSLIRGPLRARDTSLMVAALRALGTTVDDSGDAWAVSPGRLTGPAEIDCGLAGTVMRFVPPVAALADGIIWFDGDESARARPMAPTIAALRSLGVVIEDQGRGALPFSLLGSARVAGGAVHLDASGSSQFVSGLLLAGARYDRGIDVRHVGSPVPSLPHIAMTVEQLRLRGVGVDESPDRWMVRPGPVRATDVHIEPDLSNAAPFLAAALATRGTVEVRDWPRATSQGGDVLRHILTMMGARVELTDRGLRVSGGERILGIQVDLHEVGELTPVVAALCALADGPSHLRGIAHLRGHETDRLAALTTEINRLGGAVVETADGLDIHPRPLHGGVFRTYEDHRIAHAAAVLGLAVSGIEVDDIAATSKTHPDFRRSWMALLGRETAHA